MRRPRWLLSVVACLLIAGGLATRSPLAFPAGGIIATYGGDTLWATLLLVLVFLVRPTLSARMAGLVALGLAFTVEFSQLVHWPLLVALRSTRLGGLILGYGFLWSDLACYTVGVALGLIVDGLLRGRASTEPTSAPISR